MVWVYQHHRYACQARFVGNKLSQLIERPIAVPCSLFSTLSPDPRANTRQIFQANRSVRALRCLNETLADYMIGVFLKSPLATCQPRIRSTSSGAGHPFAETGSRATWIVRGDATTAWNAVAE